jgi:sulfatase maturation enzyme AslB (radical SAM superfamily)
MRLAGPTVDLRKLKRELARSGPCCADISQSGGIGEVYMILHFDCNLRCVSCALWGKSGACKKQAPRKYIHPAKIPDWTGFVRQLAPFKPGMITFSGGEPLLYDDWYAPALEARRLGMQVAITTNGTLLAANMAKVLRACDQVNVSLDGPPELQRKVTEGPQGYYEDIIRGLQLLTRAKQRLGARAPKLRILYTIYQGNCTAMPDTVRYLRSRGVAVDEYWFQHLLYNSDEEQAAQAGYLRAEGMRPWFVNGFSMVPRGMDFAAFDAAIREVKKLEPHCVFSAGLRGAALKRYYTGKHDWSGSECCTSPWRHLTALPNGDLWVCFDYVIGNIMRRDFAAVWGGEKARALRQRLCGKMLPACRGCFDYYSLWPEHG